MYYLLIGLTGRGFDTILWPFETIEYFILGGVSNMLSSSVIYCIYIYSVNLHYRETLQKACKATFFPPLFVVHIQ